MRFQSGTQVARTASFRDSGSSAARWSSVVMLIRHLLQPIHVLTVDGLLDGNVRHRSSRRRAVPVLDARRKPDHVPGSNLLFRAAPLLHEAKARRDEKGLADRMRVPSRAGAGLERDVPAGDPRWSSRGKERVNPNRAREVLG